MKQHVNLKSNGKHRIGIDVGLYSVGFACIEVDERRAPKRILNSVVYVHDAGVDPSAQKTGITRRAVSGRARRARRLVRNRKKRLGALDSLIESLGWPLPSLEDFENPYEPWLTRKQLVEERLEGEEQKEALAIAVRHMARHRGWRSPWERPESLLRPAPESEFLADFRAKVLERGTGEPLEEGLTPAQVVCALGLDDPLGATKVRFRGVESKSPDVLVVPLQKLHQSDNANELRAIGAMQGLSDEVVAKLIGAVFRADSPKGKAGERAGFDALPGQERFRRAGRWSLAFQQFKIVSVVANLRIRDAGGGRVLSAEEKRGVIGYLMASDGKERVTWYDVAEDVLGIEREDLLGTASLSADGERPSANPPTNTTNERILASKSKAFKAWWKAAGDDAREAMLAFVSNADEMDEEAPGAEEAGAFLAEASEDDLGELDKVARSLPKGRAAYSVDSLSKLTAYMLDHSVDFFEARKAVFEVGNDWRPPADPVGMPVGNPAVDRVLKIIARYLKAAEREFGKPVAINIEHVRDGFGSVKIAREYEAALKRRNARNEKMVDEIRERLEIEGPSRADRERFAAVRRQNCQCLYCGGEIGFTTCEMDHIVPRKGRGSTNTRDNLVAVCRDCNQSKGKIPFAVWAAGTTRANVSLEGARERIDSWLKDDGMSAKEWKNYRRAVFGRLRKASADEEVDNRSIESVAWMANEARARIAAAYPEAEVQVFRGSLTAAARKVSGFEGKVRLIGGNGKTRLDRRHHAMDAATIALMRPGIAHVLAIRENMRISERVSGNLNDWSKFRGHDGAQRAHFEEWVGQMARLRELFNAALENDEIPVMRNLRLRLGNSKAHDDKVRPMKKKAVGASWTLDEIDQAETPALWCALVRCPDFDPAMGLPENPGRVIRVNGTRFSGGDAVGVFGKNIAALKVRGGWVEIGGTIHHARLYRIEGKKPAYAMIRVFACDLQRHCDEDLFSVELAPQSISMRTAEPKLKRALAEGRAVYLGWVVVGDELVLDLSDPVFDKGQIGALKAEFGGQWPLSVSHWRIAGFFSPSRFRLKPAFLAGEGLRNLPHEVDGDVAKIVDGQGWLPAVNIVAGKAGMRVVRRSALGRERWGSDSGLPSSHVLTKS